MGEKRKRNYHVGMWLFLAVQALFLVWVISGIASAGNTGDCGTLDRQTCQDAANTGTAIGVGIVIAFWAFVDVILGMIWLIVHFARKGKDR